MTAGAFLEELGPRNLRPLEKSQRPFEIIWDRPLAAGSGHTVASPVELKGRTTQGYDNSALRLPLE